MPSPWPLHFRCPGLLLTSRILRRSGQRFQDQCLAIDPPPVFCRECPAPDQPSCPNARPRDATRWPRRGLGQRRRDCFSLRIRISGCAPACLRGSADCVAWRCRWSIPSGPVAPGDHCDDGHRVLLGRSGPGMRAASQPALPPTHTRPVPLVGSPQSPLIEPGSTPARPRSGAKARCTRSGPGAASGMIRCVIT